MHTHHSRKASDLIVPIPKSIEDWEGTFRLHPRIAIAAEKGFEAVHHLALELFGCKAGGEDILFKYQAGMEQEAYILTIS
jgi:hexosaminidase